MSRAPLAVVLDAGPEHLGAAVGVMHRAFAQYAESGEPSGAMLETEQTLLAERAQGVRIAIATRAGVVVAMVKHQDAGDGSRYFGRLAVDPDARGGGVARALVEALRDDARRAGRTGLSCVVRESEPGNVSLYRRLGMVVTGRGERLSRTGATLAVVEMADA